MKKIMIAAIWILLTSTWCYSQQGIGIGTPAPDPRAILELKSASQGLLLARVPDTNAINGGGVAGLLIYALSDNKYYVHNGSSWKQIGFCTAGSPGGRQFLSALSAGKPMARPEPAPQQAILELRSSNRGLLLPRVADTSAITGGGIAGLLLYATKDNRVYLHNGTAWMQLCYSTNGTGGPASISSFTNCPGMAAGTFTQGIAGNGTLTLNYSGGNGGTYAAINVASTGVTGLTAQLAAGTLTNSNGALVFTITGTPATSGTASFPVTLGGQTCIMSIPVRVGAGAIAGFTNCPGTVNGAFTQGIAGSGFLTLNYSGGNGGTYAAMNVASMGVAGLTAQLAAGTLTNSNGALVFTITGTPATSGTASFPVTLGGQTCIMSIPVRVGAGTIAGFTNCPGAAGGAFTQGIAGNGTIALYYSGGNGGTYAAVNVASTGVTGLVARLNAGSFTTGNGSLVFTVSGTPFGSGTAYFTVTVGGRTCSMRITVATAVPPVVNNVTITGSYNGYKNNGTLYPIIRPGSPLTCQYTYSGPPEGATVYTWYVTDRTWDLYANFDNIPVTWHVVKSGSGPANRTYTPGYQDLKHFIKCEVAPVTVSGIRGATKSSNVNPYVYQ